jgi:hypothetical protein
MLSDLQGSIIGPAPPPPPPGCELWKVKTLLIRSCAPWTSQAECDACAAAHAHTLGQANCSADATAHRVGILCNQSSVTDIAVKPAAAATSSGQLVPPAAVPHDFWPPAPPSPHIAPRTGAPRPHIILHVTDDQVRHQQCSVRALSSLSSLTAQLPSRVRMRAGMGQRRVPQPGPRDHTHDGPAGHRRGRAAREALCLPVVSSMRALRQGRAACLTGASPMPAAETVRAQWSSLTAPCLLLAGVHRAVPPS